MSDVILDPFSEVLADYKAGKMIVLIDHADRENEGDITVATEALTPEMISFMMYEARGLICVSLSTEDAVRLNLPLQTLNNNSPYNTPFTVSVDHKSVGAGGVTAKGRCATMRALASPDSVASDFVSPGHVFPLVANPAGVIGRQGQTEGSYDLSRLCSMRPSGVVCEILGADGKIIRGGALNEYAKRFDLKITSVSEIIRYRVQEEILVREVAQSTLTTNHGKFNTYVFEDDVDGKEHLVLISGDPALWAKHSQEVTVRIHSECLTGDLFGSRRCDCGDQLSLSLEQIAKEGGVLLYLQQEGRGIGLGNKLRAYALQDQGHDTFDANVRLGFEPDSRDFAVAAKILGHFGVTNVRLLTNNPDKVNTLTKFGISVKSRVPLVAPVDELSRAYLKTKREKFGHLI